MKMNSIFTGKFLKYWYIAFFIVIGYMFLLMANNGAVSQYELTIYDEQGKVVETKIMDRNNWQAPESLPVTKSYRPIKPLDI